MINAGSYIAASVESALVLGPALATPPKKMPDHKLDATLSGVSSRRLAANPEQIDSPKLIVEHIEEQTLH